MSVDWGDGSYEQTARDLVEAAHHVVSLAEVVAGERVLDLGCGTGNAALELARRGAQVTAVDPAERLLEVTRSRAEAEGLALVCALGDGAAVDVADDYFDAVVAVFSVIFAPDASATAREMMRVVRPGGRVLVASWVPSGAFFDAVQVLYAGQPKPAPSPWGTVAGIDGLFAPFGVEPVVTEASLPFEAASVDAYVTSLEAHHPSWLAARRARGEDWPAVREAVVETFAAHNESVSAFRVTSRYLVTRVEVDVAGAGPGR
ncbi:MAG: class I SAM-dependent methyltransferase [Myxococcales bacterium]|nr:class I SAM-dependent methyltransferase [Myxococcales bacterium]